MNWKKIRYSEIKKGTKVRIIDCEEIRKWHSWRDAVGNPGIVTRVGRQGIFFIDHNKYGITFTREMVERVWKDE